jgi:signal transduction histidine kinase
MGLYEYDMPAIVSSLAALLVYAVLLVLAVRRKHGTDLPVIFFMVYLLVAAGLSVTRFVGVMGWAPVLDATLLALIGNFAVLLLSLLLLETFLNFVGQSRKWLFAVGLVVVFGVMFLRDFLALFAAWAVISLITVLLFARAFLKTRQPIQRNRVTYWGPVLLLSIANDMTVFYQNDAAYGVLRILAVLLMGYVLLQHHILDTRDVFRAFLVYLTTIILSMGVYIGGFLLAQSLLQNTPGFNSLLIGASIALLISVIYAPLHNFVRGMMDKYFKVEMYDSSQTLREYSINISNILDIDKLAAVALETITRALEIDRGILFLIDVELGADANKVYRLTAIHKVDGGTLPSSGRLRGDSPVAVSLSEGRKPLLQYDIDFAPPFRNTEVLERKWLVGLDMDVYVPIISKDEWIGLLAFGPKSSRRRYTEDDLTLLSTVASQTGVALQNARLVENLKKLNNQIREAYAFLDKANHDLAKIESTKSNFISIASHELRTPLTVAKAYTEMLLENDSLDSAVRDILKGIHKSTLRQIEIMDSMFDIAQIDTRTIELTRQDVFINELLRGLVQEMAKMVNERQQEMDLDLPQLPSITADPNALKKLFYHLIINAVKFTPNGGKVTISGRQVQPNNRDLPEGGVEVVITDTGVGIDKGFQEVIFTKFYQPGELINRHSTGKTKFKGSGVGLGLALSRGIVEVHGGRIWVESDGYDEEKCPGSSFHVILPLRAQSESKTVRMGSAVKMKL